MLAHDRNAIQTNRVYIVEEGPNPSTDYFYISNTVSKVEIFSVSGQLVKSFTNQPTGYQYNVSDLRSGMYMVKILDENNRVKTTKLLKQ